MFFEEKYYPCVDINICTLLSIRYLLLITLRVCHLAIGRLGFDIMSVQCRSSGPFAMHPNSISPAKQKIIR